MGMPLYRSRTVGREIYIHGFGPNSPSGPVEVSRGFLLLFRLHLIVCLQ